MRKLELDVLQSSSPVYYIKNKDKVLAIFRRTDHDSDVEQNGLQESLSQILICDYLLVNTDRHADNFGVILDADTFELKRMYPIFDNGAGLFPRWNGSTSLSDFSIGFEPALYDSFEYGAFYGKEHLSDDSVKNLHDFAFDQSALGDFSQVRVSAIENWLHSCVESYLAL